MGFRVLGVGLDDLLEQRLGLAALAAVEQDDALVEERVGVAAAAAAPAGQLGRLGAGLRPRDRPCAARCRRWRDRCRPRRRSDGFRWPSCRLPRPCRTASSGVAVADVVVAVGAVRVDGDALLELRRSPRRACRHCWRRRPPRRSFSGRRPLPERPWCWRHRRPRRPARPQPGVPTLTPTVLGGDASLSFSAVTAY